MKNKTLLIKDRNTFLIAISNILKLKNPYAISVYLYLIDQSEDFNPSQLQIAKNLNISRNSVIKALKLLQDSGILYKYYTGNFKEVDKFEFVIPSKRIV